MMTRRHLNILLAVTFLVWIVPWQGKSLWPSVMGSPYIQWPSAVLTALLSSLGLFVGLRLLHSPQHGGFRTFWPAAAFLLIFVFNVGALAVVYHMQSRLLAALPGPQPPLEPPPEYFQTRDLIRGQLAQLPWLLAAYLGSFTAVFLTGMAIVSKGRSANQALERTSQ